MKKILPYILGGIIGFALAVGINIGIPVARVVPGIRLPFGWQGPYYWVSADPSYYPQGLPFTYSYIGSEGDDSYISNLAVVLDAVAGVGLGVGTIAVAKRVRRSQRR